MDRTSGAAVNDTVAQIRQAAMESSKAFESSAPFDDVEKAMPPSLTLSAKPEENDMQEEKDDKLK